MACNESSAFSRRWHCGAMNFTISNRFSKYNDIEKLQLGHSGPHGHILLQEMERWRRYLQVHIHPIIFNLWEFNQHMYIPVKFEDCPWFLWDSLIRFLVGDNGIPSRVYPFKVNKIRKFQNRNSTSVNGYKPIIMIIMIYTPSKAHISSLLVSSQYFDWFLIAYKLVFSTRISIMSYVNMWLK